MRRRNKAPRCNTHDRASSRNSCEPRQKITSSVRYIAREQPKPSTVRPARSAFRSGRICAETICFRETYIAVPGLRAFPKLHGKQGGGSGMKFPPTRAGPGQRSLYRQADVVAVVRCRQPHVARRPPNKWTAERQSGQIYADAGGIASPAPFIARSTTAASPRT